MGGKVEVLRLLLQNGADPNICGEYLIWVHAYADNKFQAELMGQHFRPQLWEGISKLCGCYLKTELIQMFLVSVPWNSTLANNDGFRSGLYVSAS